MQVYDKACDGVLVVNLTGFRTTIDSGHSLCEGPRLGWDKTDLTLGQHHPRAWSPTAKLEQSHRAPSVRTV